MSKISELTTEQLQQQLAKVAQRFKLSTDNCEKLKLKNIHSAIKKELQRREETIQWTREELSNSSINISAEDSSPQGPNSTRTPIGPVQDKSRPKLKPSTGSFKARIDSNQTERPAQKEAGLKANIVPKKMVEQSSRKTRHEELPKKSSRFLWSAIGVIFGLMVLGCGYYILKPSQSNQDGKTEANQDVKKEANQDVNTVANQEMKTGANQESPQAPHVSPPQCVANEGNAITPTAVPQASTPPQSVASEDTKSITQAQHNNSGLTQEDVLSIKDGKFYLDGRLFAEFSFNKHDLFWRICESAKKGMPLDDRNPVVQMQDQALAELSAMGFKTIRIFGIQWANYDFTDTYADSDKRESVFYAAVNKTLDLCDKHGIRVNYSLAAHEFYDRRLSKTTGKWEYGDEHMQDLLRKPESKSRKRLYAFLEEFIPRMKGRKAIAMWEIGNEVTLAACFGDPAKDYLWGKIRMPSHADVAGFYRDIRAKILELDPLRIVNNGGANMNPSQWNIYLGNKKKIDTFEEQFKAFELILATTGVDVMDIHSYPDNRPGGGYPIMGENGQEEIINLHGYMKIAARLKMPLMVGELGVRPFPKTEKYAKKWAQTPDYFESLQNVDAAKKWVKRAVDEVVEAGVPLVYWWTYFIERPDFEDLRKGRDDELIEMICDANRRLKAKLGVK